MSDPLTITIIFNAKTRYWIATTNSRTVRFPLPAAERNLSAFLTRDTKGNVLLSQGFDNLMRELISEAKEKHKTIRVVIKPNGKNPAPFTQTDYSVALRPIN